MLSIHPLLRRHDGVGRNCAVLMLRGIFQDQRFAGTACHTPTGKHAWMPQLRCLFLLFMTMKQTYGKGLQPNSDNLKTMF